MQEIEIHKKDVLEQLYFVLSLIQNSNGPMRSRIGNKNDYMGGIIDRYINTIVESLIFTKILFPKLKTNKKVELIRDFYFYDPSIASIAPDLFGIILDNKAIPFVVYDDGWKAVKNCPQVEIKTLKKNQRMLSLVNQHYDDKYLIITESDYNIDYLMPFIDKELFNDKLYKEMVEKFSLYDDKIILKDSNGYIKMMNKVDFNCNELGKLKLFITTKTKYFMEACNIAGKGVTPECLEKIEMVKEQKENPIPMKKFCDICKNSIPESKNTNKGYFRFNDKWYSILNKDGKKYRPIETTVTLDFQCSNIDAIDFLKMHKSNFYIRTKNVKEPIILNNEILQPGKDYKINLFSGFDRSGTNNEEYFIDKKLYSRILSCEESLLNEIQEIINNN